MHLVSLPELTPDFVHDTRPAVSEKPGTSKGQAKVQRKISGLRGGYLDAGKLAEPDSVICCHLCHPYLYSSS